MREDKTAPLPKKHRGYSDVASVALPDRAADSVTDMDIIIREEALAVLRNWVDISTWNFSRAEVSAALADASERLR